MNVINTKPEGPLFLVIRYTVSINEQKRCFYPGYFGIASFTVKIREDRIEGEGKREENSDK